MEKINKYETQIKELESKIEKRYNSKSLKTLSINDLQFKRFELDTQHGVFINAIFTDGKRKYDFECFPVIEDKPMLIARSKDRGISSSFDEITEKISSLIEEHCTELELAQGFALRTGILLTEYFKK